MSHSANHYSKNITLNRLNIKDNDATIQKIPTYKRDASVQESVRKNMSQFNPAKKNYPTNLSTSSLNTNISNMKEIVFVNPYDIKPFIEFSEFDFESNFIPKRKLLYQSPKIFNNKLITFQKSKNKNILDFKLFDDNLIFKEINPSYLQDEHSDDGSESSDERIKNGKKFLTQEIENTMKELHSNLSVKKNNKNLSRKMRFSNS